MKITQEIRDFAVEGMEQKSKEFKEMGGEVYIERPVAEATLGD